MNPMLDLTLQQATELMTQTLGSKGEVTVELGRRLGVREDSSSRRLAPRSFIVTVSTSANATALDEVLAVDAAALAEVQANLFPNAAPPTMEPPVVEVVVVIVQEVNAALAGNMPNLTASLPDPSVIAAALESAGVQASVDLQDLGSTVVVRVVPPPAGNEEAETTTEEQVEPRDGDSGSPHVAGVGIGGVLVALAAVWLPLAGM